MSISKSDGNKLDKMLKAKGIDKGRFFAEQYAKALDRQFDEQRRRHPCVLLPRDPVSGRPAVKSDGPFGPHYSAPYGLPFMRKRRIWREWPMMLHVGVGKECHTVLDGDSCATMWGSSEIKC